MNVASSNEQIVKVNDGFTITGIAIGSAMLTVTSKDLKMEIPVNVMGKAASIVR